MISKTLRFVTELQNEFLIEPEGKLITCDQFSGIVIC